MKHKVYETILKPNKAFKNMDFQIILDSGVLSSKDFYQTEVSHNEQTTIICLENKQMNVKWIFEESNGATICCLEILNNYNNVVLEIIPIIFTTAQLSFVISKNGVDTILKKSEQNIGNKIYSTDIAAVYADNYGLLLETVYPQKCVIKYECEIQKDFVQVCAKTILPMNLTTATKLKSEKVFISYGDMRENHEKYAELYPKQVIGKQVIGWNSWDYYFTDISYEGVMENVNFIKNDPVLQENIEYIVLDDGWECREGDWFENYRFRIGLNTLCENIQKQGFKPGIWIAPVYVNQMSALAQREFDFAILNEYGDPQIIENMLIVDPTHPRGEAFLRSVFSRLYQYGFRYFKIDFVSSLLEAKQFYNKDCGPYDALRTLIKIVRECVTEESYILGCSVPEGVGYGFCEAGRIGIDIHNQWNHVQWVMETAQYSLWKNQKIWRNDFDFLVVRGKDTSVEEETNVLFPWKNHIYGEDMFFQRWRRGEVFTLEEAKSWASLVMLSNGNIFLSDRLSKLNKEGLDIIHFVFSHIMDATPQAIDLFDSEYPYVWQQKQKDIFRYTLINWDDVPKKFTLQVSGKDAKVLWQNVPVAIDQGIITLTLPSHSCEILEIKP